MKTWINSADLLTCARAIKKDPSLVEGPAGQILSIDSVLAAAERLYELECIVTKFNLGK